MRYSIPVYVCHPAKFLCQPTVRKNLSQSGQIKCFSQLLIKPSNYCRISVRFHWLSNDICIQDGHSHTAGAVGVLSRTLSRLIPPNCSPKAASSEPILTRFSGRTASSRIFRISASVLRPFWVVRSLSV